MEISSGLLSLVPISDALAVKENLTMESVVLTLRSLDGRDKATKVTLQYTGTATDDLFAMYRTLIRRPEAAGASMLFRGIGEVLVHKQRTAAFSSFLCLKG